MVTRWVQAPKVLKVEETGFCARVSREAEKGDLVRKVLQKCRKMTDVDRMLEASTWEVEGNIQKAKKAYERFIQRDREDWDRCLRWIHFMKIQTKLYRKVAYCETS